MDAELRTWTEDQNRAVADFSSAQQRANDQLAMISRELANIAMMLAPRINEGPSPLEQLLAQLVAQGKESISHLRDLVQQGKRIEAKLNGDDRHPQPADGNGKETRR